MQGVVYVMASSKKLYRTRGSNPARNRDLKSRYQGGSCVERTGRYLVIEADVFVENLFVRFKPPFRVQ